MARGQLLQQFVQADAILEGLVAVDCDYRHLFVVQAQQLGIAVDIELPVVEFRAAAVSAEGDRGLIDGAKALALTVADLLANPNTVAAIRKEFLAAK